jgi:guanylate kinase
VKYYKRRGSDMGKIYYILGKSSCGKDTIIRRLCDDPVLNLKKVTMVTTRPKRDHEIEGREYHFISIDRLNEFKEQKKVIELRTYDTCYGEWSYGLLDDGQIDIENNDYVIPGVLNSYLSTKAYFGEDRVVPIYIEVEDGERLTRALEREKQQMIPRYDELCRRFLSDEEDFSEEKLRRAGIKRRFQNVILGSCVARIRRYIEEIREYDRRYGNR